MIKIPQCPTRDPPPVYFTGVLLAGMVLVTHRKERPSEEKFKGCTSLNRDSTRAFYTRHCRQTVQDFFMPTILLLSLDILALTEKMWASLSSGTA